MAHDGYDSADARKAGCGCMVVGCIAIFIAWFALFYLSLGDCLSADNIACHARAVRETSIVAIALGFFLLAAAAVIIRRFLR